MKIVLASGNKHKYEEFDRFFANLDGFHNNRLELVSANDFPDVNEALADIDENGSSYEENSLIKARAWANRAGIPAIADDSGLEVEALDWEPGIRSARVVTGSDADRVGWLLSRLGDAKKVERRACFVACIVLAFPGSIAACDREYFSSEGRCWGSISFEPRGTSGFGYDPIFVPDGYDVTFAELHPSEKSEISHRAIAMKGMAQMMPVVLKYLLACGQYARKA